MREQVCRNLKTDMKPCSRSWQIRVGRSSCMAKLKGFIHVSRVLLHSEALRLAASQKSDQQPWFSVFTEQKGIMHQSSDSRRNVLQIVACHIKVTSHRVIVHNVDKVTQAQPFD